MAEKYNTYCDYELVKLLRGDKKTSEKAFAVLYDRYSSKVYAYCYRVLGNRDVAQDIFQDTFLRFYQHINPDHENIHLQRFLITIARNLCLNYKRNLKSNVPIEEFEYLIDKKSINDQSEYLEILNLGLDLLEFEYREPLVLRVYNDLQYDEIAEILGITEGNVRIRVHRAKEKLKKILSPYIKELQNK